LYTDMDAIRKDEDLDSIHSIYVDQWDWEKVISRSDRTLDFLKETVRTIYDQIKETEKLVLKDFPQLSSRLADEITFIHAEDLEDMYPDFSPKEREHAITKKYSSVFLIGIGYPLQSGEPHDMRAADYDDWVIETKPGYHGLDGDILVWDDLREESLELSSMGIRVDAKALEKQLAMHKLEDKKELPFHKSVLKEELPLTIGGGIGQSRLCMFLLQRTHVGEVQSSVWPEKVLEKTATEGIYLL
ncbi:MAG: aspartate--ammonia ligase, partial [Nanobdellota archaeon]